MKGKRCPVCGTKLKNGFCPKCGHDFKEQQVQETSGRWKVPEHQADEEEKNWAIHKMVVLLLVFIIIYFTWKGYDDVFPPSDSKKDSQNIEEIDPNFFNENEQKLAEKPGEEFQTEISNGYYVVGLDLPEGTYDVEVKSGGAELRVNNSKQDSNVYQFIEMEDKNKDGNPRLVKNVSLFKGSLVQVRGYAVFQCRTKNADLKKMVKPQENPLTEQIVLRETAVVGKDIQPGTYDIRGEQGKGVIVIGTKENEYSESIILDSGSKKPYRNTCLNVELEKGMAVTPGKGMRIRLIPSKRVRPKEMPVYD